MEVVSSGLRFRNILVFIVVFVYLPNAEATCTAVPATALDDVAAEGDPVVYTCKSAHSGRSSVSFRWIDVKRQLLAESVFTNSSFPYFNFEYRVSAPKMPILTCEVCETHDGGHTCGVIERCQTNPYRVLYSVRTVVTWPSIFASPGENITCFADGNPKPEYLWHIKEVDGSWKNVGTGKSITIELPEDRSSAEFICQAKNTFGGKDYYSQSLPVFVSKHGALIRNVIIGVICTIVLILIVAWAVMRWKHPEKMPPWLKNCKPCRKFIGKRIQAGAAQVREAAVAGSTGNRSEPPTELASPTVASH